MEIYIVIAEIRFSASVMVVVFCRSPFRKQFIHHTRYFSPFDSDPGKPLFLTPYIEKGQIDQGNFNILMTYLSMSSNSDWNSIKITAAILIEFQS